MPSDAPVVARCGLAKTVALTTPRHLGRRGARDGGVALLPPLEEPRLAKEVARAELRDDARLAAAVGPAGGRDAHLPLHIGAGESGAYAPQGDGGISPGRAARLAAAVRPAGGRDAHLARAARDDVEGVDGVALLGEARAVKRRESGVWRGGRVVW